MSNAKQTPPPNELHPIIDDVLDAIRKRTEEKDGKRVVVEEFVLPDEFVPPIHEKLKAITEENEKKEALLSLFAFAMMVEKQGWPDNAKKIKELGKVVGDLFFELQRVIASRMQEKAANQFSKFAGGGAPVMKAPANGKKDEPKPGTFKPWLRGVE